jgi:hypothetical protein
MVVATGFNRMELRSPSKSSPPYKISSKSTKDSKVIKMFLHTHLESLNVRHFRMAEATRLKNVMSRSSWMAAPAYQISRKSADRFKSYKWGTQTGWWLHKPTLIFWKWAKKHINMQASAYKTSGDNS